MSDDYLWDAGGKPDPDIQRLEQTLGRLRYARPAPDFARPRRRWVPWSIGLAAAACLAVVVGGAWLRHSRGGVAWQVSADGADRRLRVGEWLSTDANSTVRISAANVGHVDLAPNSRLRLKTSARAEQRLELAQGKIEAYITAPPRLFFVETPSAVAADLGCGYTLDVDPQGNGFLHVRHGWVELQDGDRTALVPGDGQCRTRTGVGPGTPHFDDAPDALRAALDRFDFERGGAAALDTILSLARQRDSLTLWHLLSRVEAPQRGRVFDRLAALEPPPANVSRESIVRLDHAALLRWQRALKATW